MNRKEAQRLIGKKVRAWTASNGVYCGVLKEVRTEPGRPWRGLVKITGVLGVATPFEVGRRVQRNGFRIGQEIEVGGVNVEPTEEEGLSYLDALRRALGRYTRYLEDPRPGRWVEPSIRELKKRIAEEECR